MHILVSEKFTKSKPKIGAGGIIERFKTGGAMQEKTTEQKLETEEVIYSKLEDDAITMLQSILTKGGLFSDGLSGSVCRVGYDRSKGAFLVYLASRPY